jgi:hypothetical protein
MPNHYAIPFEQIRKFFEIRTLDGQVCACVPYADFLKVLRLIAATVPVDQQWYLERYADLREALQAGAIASGTDHFVDSGYMEGRLPADIGVDERWYLQQYPDVADDIANGVVASARDHFINNGYKEGRLPHADAVSISLARFNDILKL